MDRKSIIVLILSFVLLMAWYPLMNRLYPPSSRNTNSIANPSNALVNPSPSSTNFAAPLTPEISSAPSAPAEPNVPEELLILESKETRYTFTSFRGGLSLAELKEYPETVPCGTRRAGGTNQLASLNKQAALPVLALRGNYTIEGDEIFQLRKIPNGVRAEKTFTNGFHVVKDFRLGTNYVLSATLRLENQSQEPIQLPRHELITGTATPIGTNASPNSLGFYCYDGNRAEHITEPWFANRALGCIPGTPRTEYIFPGTNVVWAAVHNQFFTLLVTPKERVPSLVGVPVPLTHSNLLPAGPTSRRGGSMQGFRTALVYPDLVLPPGQSIERHFEIFAGPKEYNTLARLGNNQDLVMDFGGFFGFFAKALLLAMNGLHALGLAYGAAIIAITVIIKVLFWPLTQASTRSMKRMAALQPQMKALQEKYKDDPKKMNLKLMEFMKENKVSPLGGCLPMLLQIPVFFGFYRMLQSAIELRGARFLWACDLSQPDTVQIIPGLGFVPFFGIPGLGLPINPLPLIMGGTQLWQAHLTPPSPGVDPMQQKIMKYMPLMFLVILYNFSAGLALYWTVQNLLTIAQMKLTRTADKQPSGAVKSLVPPVRANAPKKKK